MKFNKLAEQPLINKLRNKPIHNCPIELEWNNVVVNASTKKYETHIPESSLTILTNKKGVSYCKIGNREYKISDSTFIVINPFQEIKYKVSSNMEVETFNFHFNYNFTLKYFNSVLSNEPFNTVLLNEDIFPMFFNELHYKDSYFNKIIEESENNWSMTQFSEEKLTPVIDSLLQKQTDTKEKIQNIDKIKKSTRKELYKRLAKAKDILLSEYNSYINLEDVAKEVGISYFYFLKTFKQCYNVTPYQFIKGIRLEQSKNLLINSNKPIHQIAMEVGFQESNSFFPVFKAFYGVNPLEFRIKYA